MKFGTFIAQLPGFDLAAGARAIEQLGFESVWVGDHIALRDDHVASYPYSPNQRYQLPQSYPFSDPFVLLAYAAAATTRLRLATGVYLLPLRNPFTTAKAVATLDALCNGRLIFGVGLGWMSDEFELMGSDFRDRGARTAEYLALLTEVWSKPVAHFEGRTVKTSGFSFFRSPCSSPIRHSCWAATPTPRCGARCAWATDGSESSPAWMRPGTCSGALRNSSARPDATGNSSEPC